MARLLTAYLTRAKVPARQALQQAIDGLKLELTLDDGYAPFAKPGYLPCTLHGEDAGFDLRFEEVASVAAPSAEAAATLAGRDVALRCRWSSDPREEAAALNFCAALVSAFDAVVETDKAGQFLGLPQLIAKAKALEE